MSDKYQLYNAFEDVLVKVYQDGRIKTIDHQKTRINGRMDNRKGVFLRPSVDRYGYEKVVLTSNGKRKTFFVHQLVALAYIPNPLNKPTVNHINGNKRDNRVENLEWATNAEQRDHAIRADLCNKNIEALSLANIKRSRPIKYNGIIYPSIRAASRELGIERKKIKKEGEFIDE